LVNGLLVSREKLGLLLSYDADAETVDNLGRSLLTAYLSGPQLSIESSVCRMLIESGSNITIVDQQGRNAAHVYGYCIDVEVSILRLLNDFEVNLGAKDGQGRTLLHYGALYGWLREEHIHYLVNEIGIALDLRDNSGLTAYEHAIKKARRHRSRSWGRPHKWKEIESLLQTGPC
jgi:hypothetical protein